MTTLSNRAAAKGRFSASQRTGKTLGGGGGGSESFGPEFFGGDGEHGGGGVGEDDLPGGPQVGGDAGGEVAAAGGEVQHAHAGAGVHHHGGGALPQPVRAQRHGVVHPVVIGRDAGEDIVHPPPLFRRRNACESEVHESGAGGFGSDGFGGMVFRTGPLRRFHRTHRTSLASSAMSRRHCQE